MESQQHMLDIMTQEAIEFGEWVSRVAVPALHRGEPGRHATTDMEVDDVVVATADYKAAADDEVSLKAGDIVEVLDTKAGAGGSKYRGRVYRYENHFFRSRGSSLDYVFSVPTYKMYYY